MIPRILFVGGGSIGHLAPAIAVARAVQRAQPGAVLHVLCTADGTQKEFLAHERLSFTVLPPLQHSTFLFFHLLRACAVSLRVMRRHRPHAIFAKGGLAGIAAYAAARVCAVIGNRTLFVLHESDVVMGRANRLLARFADVVCLGFPSATNYKQQATSCIVTGNPVLPEITRGSRAEGFAITGFSGEKPVLLVIGGSQGAQAINAAILALLPQLLPWCDIIHVTGRGKTGALQQPGYCSRQFFSTRELPHIYACTSLAVSRAGAGAISELASCAIPTILVPLRGLAQDHQQHNALQAVATGGCVILQQEELSRHLSSVVRNLLIDSAKRNEISQRIRRCVRTDAAENIARILLRGVASFAGDP